MVEQLKKLYKKIFKSKLLVAAVICFLIATVAFLLVGNTKTTQVKGVSTIAPSPTATSAPTESPVPTVGAQINKVITKVPTSTGALSSQSQNSGQVQQSSNSTPQATAQPTNTPAPQAQNLQINLSVNGSSVGQVSVSSGATQCDVLREAKNQGKISSLNMRYDGSLGTYGVYQINGIGKDNAIWWTYSVNGSEPGQGCSYVKAASGDNVNWKYIGS